MSCERRKSDVTESRPNPSPPGPQNPNGAGKRPPVRPIRYLPALDGIRTLAALAVILGHAGSIYPASPRLLSQGGLLVITFLQIFFVTSGFLIYRPLVAKLLRPQASAGGPRTSFGGFILRRFLRIFPLYWAVLAIKCGLQGAGDVRGLGEWVQLLALSPLPDPGLLARGGLGFAMWTLAIELPFYILLPLFANGTAALARGPLRSWATFDVQLLAVGSLVGSVILSAIVFAKADLLALLPLPLGMLLAVVEVEQWQRQRRFSPLAWLADRWWLCLGTFLLSWQMGAYISYEVFAGRAERADVAISALVPSAMAMFGGIVALFITLSFGRPSPLSRLFGSLPFQALAPLTYGTYLWHPVLLRALADRFGQGLWVLMVGTVALSVLAAFVTSLTVEAPLARLRWWVDRHQLDGTARPNPAWTLPWVRPPGASRQSLVRRR